MENQLQELLSKSESDLEFFGYMDIGRVRRIAPAPRASGVAARELEFARILRQILQRSRDWHEPESKAA